MFFKARSMLLFFFLQNVDAFLIVCVYDNEAALRPLTAKLHVRDVDPSFCTHLVYKSASIQLQSDETVEIVASIPQVDVQQDGFLEVTALKRRFPALRILISLTVTNNLVNLLIEGSSANNYTAAFLNFLSTHNFDGYCLDFNLGKFAFSNQEFPQLFTILGENLKANNYILSAFIPPIDASKTNSNIQSWIPFLNKFDFVGISAYNLHVFSTNQALVNSHSPLYAPLNNTNCLNVECVVNAWINKGLSPTNIILGIATYGVSFTLSSAKQSQLYSEAIDSGTPGAYLRKKGIRAHYEICSSLKTDSWSEFYDKSGRVPFAVSGRQWVGYENASSVIEKVKFARDNNMSGVFIWTLDTDDFMGMCGKPWVLTIAATTTNFTLSHLNESVIILNDTPDEVLGIENTFRYNCTSDGIFPHPENCGKFILCTAALFFYVMDCPESLHFNVEKSYCDWPLLANCTILEFTKENSTKTEFNCQQKSGHYPNPGNCSSFYWCAEGLLVGHLHCPSGLLFNDEFKVCDWPINVNCNPAN